MNFECKLDEALEPLDETLVEMFKKYFLLHGLSHTANPLERRMYRESSRALWKRIEQHPHYNEGLCPEFEAAIDSYGVEHGIRPEPLRRDAPPERDK